jgi:hypothetical protein
MGLFDRFKKKPVETVVETVVEPVKVVVPVKVKKPRKPKVKKPAVELTAKEKATQAGEPYVNVLSMEIDPTNIQNGAFELDWNEIFIARLVKSGYMMNKDDKDSDIVDRWFHQVCRNIVLEMYEQQQADPTNRDLREVNVRNLGNGRTEVS